MRRSKMEYICYTCKRSIENGTVWIADGKQYCRRCYGRYLTSRPKRRGQKAPKEETQERR